MTSTFNINDRVVHKTEGDHGVVIEIESPTVLRVLWDGAPEPESVAFVDIAEPKSRFRAIAELSISRGENRILPIVVGAKKPAVVWNKLAINIMPTDKWSPLVPGWINEQDEKFSDLNACVIAKPDEFLFVDHDTMKEFRDGYEKFSGKPYPVTFTTSARENRCQEHWLQTDLTRRLGNVAQFNVDGIDLSVRQHNLYVLAEGSLHPSGSTYEAVVDAPVIPMPDDMVEYISFLKGIKLDSRAQTVEPVDHSDAPRKSATDEELDAIAAAFIKREFPNGIESGHGHDDGLTKLAGKLRGEGAELGQIEAILLRECPNFCLGAGSDWEAMALKCARSISKKEVGADLRCPVGGTINNNPVAATRKESNVLEFPANPTPIPELIDEQSEAAIPPFDPSVITGIYKEMVDLICAGTTLQPQFPYAMAKTVIGARMASGGIKFENLDTEPRLYTAIIGETGSGKGWSWERMSDILRPQGHSNQACGIKIIAGADSGAGIKDAFFESPEDFPILCFIGEVRDLGNKSKDTRNPSILDTMIELADTTSISRVLAKRKGEVTNKTKYNARLSTIMCGQDGKTFMGAFAGRTQMGLWDRLYPEFSRAAEETGDAPPVNEEAATALLTKIATMNYSGLMTMSDEAKDRVHAFWKSQAPEVRKKVRWKKNMMLDAYLTAFGRGSMRAELTDVEIAIKIFDRQLIIRRVCFCDEVPDRIGYYYGLIKKITENMQREIAAGVNPAIAAKSRRDYETLTHAFRDNEVHIFDRAWHSFAPNRLDERTIKKNNGHEYQKFIPKPEDPDPRGE